MEAEKKKKPSIPLHNFKPYLLGFWIMVALPFFLIAVMISAAAFSKLPSFEELENPQSLEASEVYSSDGVILGKYFRENRVNVNYDQISPYMIQALVSTEDERFFEHPGIDFEALGRVVKGVLTASTSQGGGSTITQQLAKMLFSDRPESRWERVNQKFKEWIIALKLERSYAKEEILTMYLNKFDYVNNAVGIKSAAAVYFNTTPDSLKLHQAAMLVGMCKNPALYNPLRRPEETMQRRNVVFYQMVRNDIISQEAFDSLKVLPLDLDFQIVSHVEGPAPYFREVLRASLRDLLNERNPVSGGYTIAKADGTPYDMYSDGLKVYTTINSKMQAHAEFAMREHMSKWVQPTFFKDLNTRKRYKSESIPFDWRITDDQIESILNTSIHRTERYRSEINRFANCDSCKRSKAELERFKKDSIPIIFNKKIPMKVFSYDGDIDTIMSPIDSIKYYKAFLRSGLVSIDPGTGFIKAWVGGIDYKYFKFDQVQLGKNQVGSTFKPMVYATGIREGLNPCQVVPNVLTCFDMPAGQPRYCPRNSDGKYEGVVTLKEGLAKSMNNITAWVLKQYGPEAVVKLARDMGITTPLDAVPSLCLGVADINLKEITAANAVFANNGVYIEPMIITRIEDKNGKSIYDAIPKTREALDERTSYIMIEMMKGVVNFGTGNRLRRNYPYGNIPHPMAGKTGTTQSNSDGWFIGLTPELVTGVWVGGEERSIRFARTANGQGASTALPIFGYYMNRIYNDAELKFSTADFERPASADGVDLNCTELNKSIKFDTEFNFEEE